MKRAVTSLAIGVVVTAAIIGLGTWAKSGSGRTQVRQAPTETTNATAVPEDAASAANWLGDNMGDEHPTAALYFAAVNRNDATKLLLEAGAPNDSPSDVVVLKGDFAYSAARSMGDGDPPTGSLAIAIVNPLTGQITDFGVRATAVDLDQLGPSMVFACCPVADSAH